MALKRIASLALGGLDLNAEESAVTLDGDVVRGRVSPGTGDGESVLGGAGHEKEFGPFSALFGVLDVDGVK